VSRRSVLLVLGLAAAPAGCGYGLGYRTPPSVVRVAVPIFDNQTFPLRREIEYALTSEFRKAIQTRTELVLASEDDADMAIYGTIKDFQERVVAEGENDRKLESTVFIRVLLIVEDYQNARRREERVEVAEPLSTEAGQPIEAATARAIQKLADRMLDAVEYWGDL
jgi:hypothetical protein